MSTDHDKSHRASASQFYVAAELCRQGLVANVTLGNCPNVDILCTNKEANRFVHIQVKTFVPGNRTCSVGIKAEKDYGKSFFWVLAGIPEPNQSADFQYFVIPSHVMARNVREQHEVWSATPGMKGQKHNASTTIRALGLPPRKSRNGWALDEYLNRWDLILSVFGDDTSGFKVLQDVVRSTTTQRKMMCELIAKYGDQEETLVREYAAAERRGDVQRLKNERGLSPWEYARRLLYDARKKGWISGSR